MRSLVPIEKKSASSAKISAITATAGISTMMPHGIGAIPTNRFFGEDCLCIAQLCNRGDHREHDPDLAEFRCAEEGAKLRAKDFRPVESDANSPLAEERIVLLRNWQIGERLVSADIQGADDERLFPADHLCDRLYSSNCLSSLGAAARSMKRNSERSKPTPSPPSSATSASLSPPILAATSM